MNLVPQVLITSWLVLMSFAAPEVQAGQNLYLSAGDKLTVYQLDTATGKLTEKQVIDLPAAGPIGVSPDEGKLYVTAAAGSRKAEPAIATFELGHDGSLRQLNLATVNIRPGYLRTDATGRFLAGNHYSAGKATVWRLERGVYHGETAGELILEKNAHCSVFSPDNRFLLVPATGPNKVFVNRFDAKTGKATPHDPAFAAGPQRESAARQPRHLVFHPNGRIVYTTNERSEPGVCVWTWNAKAGSLETVQNIVTRPHGFEGFIATADLHLTPDARFLYLSNRDVTDRQARTGTDDIVAFSVAAKSGRLTKLGHFACEHVPRSFTIDETGNFLFVAGQGDDRLGVYRIDPQSGKLSKVAQYETGSRPSWVHCMSAPATAN